MISCLQKLGSRAIFQHDPQTHIQDDHCLAEQAKGIGDGPAKFVSRPKPYRVSVGHPQMEGEGVEGVQHPLAP